LTSIRGRDFETRGGKKESDKMNPRYIALVLVLSLLRLISFMIVVGGTVVFFYGLAYGWGSVNSIAFWLMPWAGVILLMSVIRKCNR
jgi:hypothetical protein